MLKELSWYIETNRFSEIVKEIEEKAENYSQALTLQDERVEKIREEFRSLCQWHIEKSGYKTEETSYINVDTEFFNGANINREALDTFEKEIIKAHMYQKHLWEFMGTTGNMTIISKEGMKKDGFHYERYLPLEYKKIHKAKSPISNILDENSNTVPIYMYSDGTISSEYSPEKSKIRFDVLKDKSGFDWSRKGWDPNYEVEKNDWHGEYDDNNSWVMVKESKNETNNLPGAKIQETPVIEIIKDNEMTILYDPGYSLISIFEKIYLLKNGEIYGAEETDIEETVKIIKTAMVEIGVKQIDIIAGMQKTEKKKQNKEDKAQIKNTTQNDKIIKLYKKLLGQNISENVEIKTTKEVQEIKKEIIKRTSEEKVQKEGNKLLEKIETLYNSGSTGEEIIKTLKTNKIKEPLSIYNRQDCKNVGISEEDFNILQNYYVPEAKKKLFSNAIINLIIESKMLLTSGKTLEELFETVYENVVQGKEVEEVISIETTFEELCKNPNKVITTEQVEEVTIEALRKAKTELPEQTTIEKQKEVEAAVENIIRNFSAIRMSTGMTPTEAVKLAVKTVGGKNGEAFVPPVSGIVYSTPGMNSSQGSANEKRIFADISLKEVIEKAKNSKPQTKEVEFKFDELKATNDKEIKQVKLDLLNKKDLNKFLKSKEFKESKIAEELIVEYIFSVKENSPAKKMLLINKEIFNKYIKNNSITIKEDIEALFAICEETKEEEIKQISINLENKKELIKLLKENSKKHQKQIDETIIEEYITETKNDSIAKKVLLLNSKVFEKYIETHSINTKADVEKLFSISETNQNTIPNLFNKTEREVWYSTESFKKCGINKEEIEQLIEEEQEKVKSNTKTINIIKEYSKTKNLEKQYGTLKEDLSFNVPTETKIARIETVTKAKSVDKVIEELKAKEIKNQDSSLIKNEARTVQQQTYIPAQIKADGRINRQILGTVSGKEFVTGRNNLLNVPTPLVSKGTNTISISEMVKQQVAEQINENKTSFVQDNTVINERIAVETYSNQDSVTQNVLQTESVEYSLETKKPKVYKKVEQTPEEIKMAKMNANYEHDKAVLAKEDPMFAKNKFWDVGHAEGSGEFDRNSYNNMLNKVKEESLMKLDEKNEQK